MRALERQPGESARAFEGFKCYRDLGPGRSVDRAYELYAGRRLGGKRAPGRFQLWSRQHYWRGRAEAYDAWLEMIGREAVEDHERGRAQDLAARRQRLREKNLEAEEAAADQLARVLDVIEATPLIRQRATRRDEDGRDIEVTIEPVLAASFDLVAARLHKIATRSEPTKIAPTDPSGEHEYGQSAEDIDKEFEQLLGETPKPKGDDHGQG